MSLLVTAALATVTKDHSKWELICDNQSVSEAMLLEAPGLHLLSRDVADNLGSPLRNVEHINDVL